MSDRAQPTSRSPRQEQQVRLEHLLTTLREWEEFAKDLPVLAPEDEALLQALSEYEDAEG